MKTDYALISRAGFRLLVGSAISVSCVLLGSSALPLRAADFVRGDANGDGKVSISDAHVVLRYLFNFGEPPDCMIAADFNDDGFVDYSDPSFILSLGCSGEPAPAAPFPEPGPDPTPPQNGEGLSCDSYGGGQPLEDAGARLVVLDATFPGGTDRRGMITIAYSSSGELAGFSGSFSHDPLLIGEVGTRYNEGLADRMGYSVVPGSWSLLEASDRDGLLSFGFVIGPKEACERPAACPWEPIPPAEDVTVMDIWVCLAPGTPAGQYPLVPEAGEFIDDATGQAIYPALQGGTLTVLSDVEESDCSPAPPSPPRPPAVVFTLGDASGVPGGSASVPFRITSNLPSQGFAFSVDFDESVLQVSEIERLFRRPSGTPYEFQRFEFNNDEEYPGDSGIIEGYLAGAAIISLANTEDVLPPDEEVDVLNFHFLIRPETTADKTEIRFLDGAMGGEGVPVNNYLIAFGLMVTPAAGGSFVFVNGILRIVPDAIPFVRGDSNADGTVDISDAIATLGHLFLGGLPLRCSDAADANDDGQVDMSDAISILDFLFRGSSGAPSRPFPEPGLDPTGDDLSC